jgi:hypothetical protein
MQAFGGIAIHDQNGLGHTQYSRAAFCGAFTACAGIGTGETTGDCVM